MMRRLAGCDYGYAVERQAFDGQHRMIDQWYLGTKLEPVNCRSGYARMTIQYDQDGHRIEAAFFGFDSVVPKSAQHARRVGIECEGPPQLPRVAHVAV